MTLFKRWFVFIFYYALAFLIANLTIGILSLILKMLLVTVQGPTMVTRVSNIVTHYISFSIASFFLFGRYGKKQQPVKYREIVLFYSLIILLHFIIVFYGKWNTVWSVTTGTIQLARIMYSGGEHIASLTYIPRVYYYHALTIRDICFVIFSLMGIFTGNKIKKLN
ncbi:hypothetical protein Amet_3353 [Alkaliphilus metalliredigens QYMF]|uniref:Uncharacterized protein n=1 Tax=Alkaliphilus metalliredigens (strain QYMF) TaxID=293826 RepID=A6TTG3_ALKMQ|nr:hypothetical protein [Alkaliphilus metalliredigens]ABR49481.1 hypothetical protein Amet_3353 [Alkaliphilus metalliredigens QYMF]